METKLCKTAISIPQNAQIRKRMRRVRVTPRYPVSTTTMPRAIHLICCRSALVAIDLCVRDCAKCGQPDDPGQQQPVPMPVCVGLLTPVGRHGWLCRHTHC